MHHKTIIHHHLAENKQLTIKDINYSRGITLSQTIIYKGECICVIVYQENDTKFSIVYMDTHMENAHMNHSMDPMMAPHRRVTIDINEPTSLTKLDNIINNLIKETDDKCNQTTNKTTN